MENEKDVFAINVKIIAKISGEQLDESTFLRWISTCLNCNPNHISVVVESAEVPTLVIDMDGGLIQGVAANGPVQVIILDADIDGTTDRVSNICGDDVVVSDHNPAHLESEYVLLVKKAICATQVEACNAAEVNRLTIKRSSDNLVSMLNSLGFYTEDCVYYSNGQTTVHRIGGYLVGTTIEKLSEIKPD